MSEQDRKRWTLIASILGLGVTLLDETVVFIALPAMERDLDLGLSGQEWVVNGYLLTLAALLLIGGALADRYGRRRVFVLGLGGFAGASAVAGLAPTGGLLVAARLLQGAMAAMVMPSTLAMLTACFRGEERGEAVGRWSAYGGIAAAIGPLVGGVLIEALSWRWIFFLSIPIAAAAIGIARFGVAESRGEKGERAALDLPGAAFAMLALGGVSFALIQGPASAWDAGAVLVGGAVGITALIGFLAREAKAGDPMMPLALFRRRNFSAANGATLALYGAYNGGFFFLIIYLQTALGYSALGAGAATLPVTLLMIGLSPRFGRLGRRIGPRAPMTTGLLIMAVGLTVLGLLSPGSGYPLEILPGVLLFGLGLSIAVAPLTDAAMSAVPDERGGIASGVNNDISRLAALLGIALLGISFAVSFRASLEPAPAADATVAFERARDRPTAALEPEGETRVSERAREKLEEATVDAYRVTMGGAVLIALIGALVSWVGLRDPAGSASDQSV